MPYLLAVLYFKENVGKLSLTTGHLYCYKHSFIVFFFKKTRWFLDWYITNTYDTLVLKKVTNSALTATFEVALSNPVPAEAKQTPVAKSDIL